MELKIVYPSPHGIHPSPIESNNMSILVHMELKSVHPIPHGIHCVYLSPIEIVHLSPIGVPNRGPYGTENCLSHASPIESNNLSILVHMELKIVYPSPIESNNLSILFHMELKSVYPISHGTEKCLSYSTWHPSKSY
jgi:hypothetical protein